MIRYVYMLGVIVLSVLISACQSTSVEQYAQQAPKLDLFDYFEGDLVAYGQFQGFSGEVKRRFKVDIAGEINGDTLTLTEDFIYNDGETDQRIWTIQRDGDQFFGTAGDVIGQAMGQSAGNAFNWQYDVDLPYRDGTIKVHFNDWMYLQSENYLLNRATVSKLGVNVGEVTIMFIKQ